MYVKLEVQFSFHEQVFIDFESLPENQITFIFVSGCYGTLGMESGVIADAQITASSVLEWTDHTGQENSWKPEKARLKKPGPPWAAFATDEYQWLQVDLNKEKKITG